MGRGGDRLRRALRRRRGALAAGLAATAVAVAVTAPEAGAGRSGPPPPAPPPPAERLVAAPVRIADAATVRLLRAGDRVDVVAAGGPGGHGAAPRVVAAGARVDRVPAAESGSTDDGALVVLSVPRETARGLVAAGTVSRLAVSLC
ncbi:hypothetical protein [Streptomyces sp. NPDC097619]|uniref:hypothetical protein n=1 Tax=Streptomyces sp. NPDC097619 TaxID=3157228 RepID=UPI00331983D5